ncbi:hypothetical protein [Bradyrhizobium diazoefficiens]|uniref:hypothetical protein n=1 Tax=Bradyrhizobium diazoefficiens TaxID=1355477 RepID=UPI0032E394EF
MPQTNDPNPGDPNPGDPKPGDPKPGDPKPDAAKPDAAKPDGQRADGDLTRAYERIKSAEQDLARLDRLVSGMEHSSDRPPKTAAAPAADPAKATSSPQGRIPDQSPKANRPMLRAVVILLLATGLLGAAVASQYRDEAKAIMARWAAPVSAPSSTPSSSPSLEASEVRSPAPPSTVLLAAADEQPTVPAPPVHKDADNHPTTGATPPDPKSAEPTQSLKTITDQLASINEKLEQLKSRHEQTLREQADAIQQLKTAQEKDAGDSARLAAQVQALQTQLTALSASAKPTVRSAVKENDQAARQHVQAAAPRRPRPPRGPWMPRPYMDDPYGYSDW